MKAKPKTTYKLVSPDSWRLIRAAYLSGLSAPTVAARFDISVGALRKRAAREGWTKRDFVATSPPKAAQAHDIVQINTSTPEQPQPAADARPIQERILEPLYAAADLALPRHTPPPAALGRKALLLASRALTQDRPRDALAHAKAAEAIARLDISIHDIDPAEDEENVDWRLSQMRQMIWRIAATLADHMVHGGEPPPGYRQEISDWKAERARETAEAAERTRRQGREG
jgi:hypothetical protein